MPIVVTLESAMKQQGIKLKDLASDVGITQPNLSRMKTQKIKAVRFSTLSAICLALDCQPKDILSYVPRDQ